VGLSDPLDRDLIGVAGQRIEAFVVIGEGYKQNYPRLQRAKAVWDPHDIFNHAQSIQLPG
jgi:FAD/FMN-containing dehydrogenase